MGFPGRLNEKKKPTVVFWSVIVLIVTVFGWMIWSIFKVIQEPLPVQRLQQPPIHVVEEPAFKQGKASHAIDNLKQIRKREFLRPQLKRENSSRNNRAAVTYEPFGRDPVDQNAGYYPEEKGERK